MFLFALTSGFWDGGNCECYSYSDTYDAGHYYMDPWGANSWLHGHLTSPVPTPGTQMHRKLHLLQLRLISQMIVVGLIGLGIR